jgi:RNA polymerase sigma factor (sigma-70 family)
MPQRDGCLPGCSNIARNGAIDYTRSKEFNRQGKTVSLTENVYTDDKVTGINARDTGLKKILENLPDENRKLLELSFFSGYSHQEIATMLNLPLGTVKTRLRTIIIDLRKRMDLKNN